MFKILGFASIALFMFASNVNASLISVIDMTDDSQGQTWDSDLTLGYDFSIATGTSLTITGLGIFDYGSNGLGFSHEVAIWSEASGVALASTSVGPGTSSTLSSGNSAGEWVYESITALTLGAGDYTIGAFYGANSDIAMVHQTAVNNISGVTYTQGQYVYDSTFQQPLTNYAANEDQYFGPVMVTAVPEPSIIVLFGLGLLGLGFARRRKVQS